MDGLRRIFSLVRPYAGRIVLAGLCSLAVSAANGALAWLVKPAVDEVFVGKNPTSIVLLSLGIMTVFMWRGCFRFMNAYLMTSAGAKVVRDMRNRLYRHLLHLPVQTISRDSSGAMVSRVLNDAGMLQSLLASNVKDLIVEGGTALVLISIAMYSRWDLTLFAVVVLPFAFTVVGRIGRRLKKVSGRTQEKISSLTELVTESFNGSRIIKSFCKEEVETNRFHEKNQDFYRELMRSTRIVESSSLIMEFVAGSGIGFVVWYGGHLVLSEAMTAGDFFRFLAAIFMIYTPAKRLASSLNALQQSRAPLERVEQFLALEQEQERGDRLPSFDREIVFDRVSFRYEGTDEDALREIAFTARKGEMIALVGRSGAGKTTFVDLIPRFQRPTAGTVAIDGRDIADVSLHSLRSLIGIVSQDVILFNDTVRANIAYGKPDATEEEIVAAARAAYAHDFITELSSGYDTVVGERGVRLSGGQKQRISIARAILKNPPILILDEATSSLDTASEIMVQRALENLMNDRTAFVIAHRLSTVRRATRIVVLDKGRITESGSHEELLSRGGAYERLYRLQFEDSPAGPA